MCRRKCWRTPHTTSEMFCEGEAATLLYSRVGEEKLGRFACRGDTPVDSGHPTDDEHHTFHNATPTRICWCVLMLHQSGQEKTLVCHITVLFLRLRVTVHVLALASFAFIRDNAFALH